jgi:hypothetical protein
VLGSVVGWTKRKHYIIYYSIMWYDMVALEFQDKYGYVHKKANYYNLMHKCWTLVKLELMWVFGIDYLCEVVK